MSAKTAARPPLFAAALPAHLPSRSGRRDVHVLIGRTRPLRPPPGPPRAAPAPPDTARSWRAAGFPHAGGEYGPPSST